MSKKRLYTPGIVYSTNPDLNRGNEENEEVISLPANEQLLKVSLDKKNRGGKVVTLIDGFQGSDGDLESLARQLKAFCGTGGSAKNSEILIQGDNRDKILQWLHKNGYARSRKT